MIKIEWPFGPKLRCAKCGKTFRYRGKTDDEALDGTPAYCNDCKRSIVQEKAAENIRPPTIAESASAPIIKAETSDKVEKAVRWAEAIANDNSHGYSQANRHGPDYDCSSLVISAFEWAEIPVGGATYTGNMYAEFVANGWQDVTGSVNRATGAGLIRGDVLLNSASHTCLYIGDGKVVNARTDTDGFTGDSHGDEIRIQSYWNFPWDYVLRWPADGKAKPVPLDVDGEFGPKTEAAVTAFQQETGLNPDGICGAETGKKIFERLEGIILRSGDTGWAVAALQAILNYIREE